MLTNALVIVGLFAVFEGFALPSLAVIGAGCLVLLLAVIVSAVEFIAPR